jgi:predicted thioesterase
MEIKIGESLTVTTTVTEDKLAVNVGSGDLRVFATPMVVALMENASATLAKKFLDEGLTTVGTGIAIDHTSPTPFGGEVSAKATLTKCDGRTFEFQVEAYDKKGIISKGTHTRVSVKAEKFQAKADSKFDEV